MYWSIKHGSRRSCAYGQSEVQSEYSEAVGSRARSEDETFGR